MDFIPISFQGSLFLDVCNLTINVNSQPTPDENFRSLWEIAIGESEPELPTKWAQEQQTCSMKTNAHLNHYAERKDD